jgi:flavorubredoxin
MDPLTLLEPMPVAPATVVLPAYMTIPNLGVLPMSSYLIHGREPVLIDAGPGPLAGVMMAELGKLIDPADLRYVWLTHIDPDHVGALDLLAQAAPDAKFVTTFLGRGKLALQGRPIPDERFVLLDPGQRLVLEDRVLVALRPPTYDAPETIGAFDTATRALFCADTFGALLAGPADDLAAVEPERVREGMISWSAIDVPWLGLTDDRAFRWALHALVDLDPDTILGGHLPPARQRMHELVDHLAATQAHFAHRHPTAERPAKPGVASTV